MRGLTAVLLAGAALLAAAPAASPHAGHGPLEIDIAEFSYTPQDSLIYAGDSVVFTWKGPDTNHSATGDGFDTDAGRDPAHAVGDTYAVSFPKPGTFNYHCKVHSFMTGTITVRSIDGQPAVIVPPALTKVSVKPKTFARKTRLSYSVDGPVSMRATLKRGAKVVKELDFNSAPGAHRHGLDFGRKIKVGKYVLKVVAVDPSSGKQSKAAALKVEVKR